MSRYLKFLSTLDAMTKLYILNIERGHRRKIAVKIVSLVSLPFFNTTLPANEDRVVVFVSMDTALHHSVTSLIDIVKM